MASRRTRIKGIANIPQRRKASNTTLNAEEDAKAPLDSEIVEEESLNLTPKHEISDVNHVEHVEQEEQPNEVKVVETASTDTEIKRNGEICDPPPNSQATEEVVSELAANICENIDKLTQSDKTEQPAVPTRRKFIKPTVSVTAFNRKPKDNEEANKANNYPDVIKRDKIVILSEVISYPNQTQQIVIPDHSPNHSTQDEGKNLLKPPEISNGRPTVNSLEKDIRRLVPNSPQLLTPEIEYPIPPPSPNKINRSRIKAVPRLGQRNTSFSASESEDESRRNYRHRNDSVCSSASGFQDTNSVLECPSPQKPKEFNSVIQRKCRRTEQSRKLAEARRDFYLKFGNKKPDRQKLTMIDLIFYNPVTNPMSNDNKSKRKISEVENENHEEVKMEEKPDVVDGPGKTGSDEENEIPAPQIKIGPAGELIVDEQSLVIENKSVKKDREQLEKSEVVNADFETGYGIYKRAKRSKDWSKHETLKFYKALNTIGTDFTLMCELFPRRSRRELKMKFKKEEKVNKALVDKAIMQPCGFDFNDFKHEVDMEEKELLEMEKQTEREKEMKKEAKKRKSVPNVKEPPEKVPKVEKLTLPKKKRPLDIMKVLEDDSDADESEIESVEDEETEEKFLQAIQKPTRSGRVPKILDKYKAPEPENKPGKAAQPGSLIVVASTGLNGQPVYKVCMVTGENGRQQIGKDMASLEKALECKENGITSLFTLSASAVTEDVEDKEDLTPIVEHNYTIPANEEVPEAKLKELTECATET